MTPKARHKLTLWTFSIPILPYIIVMIILALIVAHLPYTDRNRVLDWFEYQIMRPIRWRNQIGIVERSYHRAHLFEHIKSFK